ncbi:type I-C CRISPR-associated protein Cas8c/Csd1 [Compostibacillus humi]|uniref:Type I-C CRISPR-associated protein Cas8c/Csd1 n=1 Tax=Compostibacillus humi TaxID=1245525 RepID=A0A8J2TRS0_9BACI|nr:type I-C CRISPR-associated protein Cas8c/Csd1 [Compostibacillus humi]GFZ88627.1 type I-C CRISPR-associated protein Cas8c/Csd1 [Compostibacillus humi]
MSWMQQLAEVYDNNHSHVGNFEERDNQRITLLPVSHVMQSAQIEILVTSDGDFVSAKVVEKEDARTIVPATTSSANRSSKSAPHYIHDKLFYVAADYVDYSGDIKREQHHKDYLDQMKQWAERPEAPKKVRAIYEYIKKGKVIEDLVRERILPVDHENKVIDKWKSNEEKPLIYKVSSEGILSAFVRFDVMHESPEEPVVWEDKKLFQDYIRYLDTIADMDKGYCYVTGEHTFLTTQHGARIRNAGDMAKLISANDSSGYTYRGRFSQPEEAVQIGYDVSQKAHHALRWLLQRQGTYVDSRYFVSFGIKQPETPDPLAGTADLLMDILQVKEEEKVFTEEIVAAEFNKALHGWKHSLTKNRLDNIIILAVDAATKGRLAIVYYQQLHADFFLDAIDHWHNTCHWLQVYRDSSNNVKRIVGAPSVSQITEAVYGSKADSRIKKELYTRLLSCIVEKKPIPKDIVQIIFNRVKNPSSFKGLKESWNNVLNIACALINKLYEGEEYSVALQEDNTSRDYLFGRLLGVAEVMESRFLKERDEKRATNATRYFNAFTQHPARTWMVIRKQLTPYFERSGYEAGYYSMLLRKIEDQLTTENMNDTPLSPVFLLGYSSQIQSLYTKKEEKENDSITEKN